MSKPAQLQRRPRTASNQELIDIGNRLVEQLANFVALVGELAEDNINLRTEIMKRDERIKNLETEALEKLNA